MKSKEELEKEPMPYDNTTPKKCPKCGNWFLNYPALSRRDNSTYICPDCGVKEAMEDYMSSMKKEGLEEVTAKALLEDPENKSLTKSLTESVDWSYYDKFEDLINKYMPDEGEGETFASQIVTAVNKLVYKWYNDGDVFDNVNSGLQGWANDLSSYANWLYKYAPGDASVILKNIYGMGDEADYETLLQELADNLLDENLLSTLESKTQGSIYDCDGPFEFREYYEDEDEDYYEDDNYDEDDEDDEEDLDESKKLQEGVNNLTIRTGLTDKNAYDVLSSVVGQLSDGIWENSPGMSRYWQHMDIDREGSEVVAKFDTQDYDSGFRDKDESQIKKWLANKVKQIVKEEGLDWNRDNTERCSYMHGSVTVQDAYRVYDKLLGRKDYIPDPNKKEESKVVMKKELNKDELLNKLEDYVLNQYTIFNDKLYDDFGDIQLNDKDNSKRSIYIYYDIEEDKISVTVGAAGARTFVDTLDEVAQFINAEIAKVNAQDEEIKKLTTEAKSLKEFTNGFNFNAFANYMEGEIRKIYPSAKFNRNYSNGHYLEVYLANNDTSRFIIEAFINTNDEGSLDDGAIQVTYPYSLHYSSEDINTICDKWTGNSNSAHFNINEIDKALEMIKFICDHYKKTDIDELDESAKLKTESEDNYNDMERFDIDILNNGRSHEKFDNYEDFCKALKRHFTEKETSIYNRLRTFDRSKINDNGYIQNDYQNMSTIAYPKEDLEESIDKDHDEYLKRMDKQYKTFCKNLELDEKDPDDALSALDELEGQFGDEDGEYQELREFIHNELLEESKNGKYTDEE